MYYRIKVITKNQAAKEMFLKSGHDVELEAYRTIYEEIVKADSKEDVTTQAVKELETMDVNPQKCEIHVDEMSIEDCIAEEEQNFKNLLLEEYISILGIDKNLPLREYGKRVKQLDFEKYPEQYYLALKEFNNKGWLRRSIERWADKENVTLATYLETIDKLMELKPGDDYQQKRTKILSKIKK